MTEALAPEALVPAFPRIVADALSERLPDLGECMPHPGKFNAAEIKRFAARTPSVRVALVGIRKRESGEHALTMAAFIVTADQRGVARDASALAIATAIMRRVIGTNWGQPCLGESEPPEAVNLYDTTVGARGSGLALWAVSWAQPIQLATHADPEPCVLRELYIGFAPEVGIEHEDDYLLVEGEEAAAARAALADGGP